MQNMANSDGRETMQNLSVKQRMLDLIQTLPEDTTVETAMERLYLLYKVERGIEQAESGQTVSQEEARRRMARWLE